MYMHTHINIYLPEENILLWKPEWRDYIFKVQDEKTHQLELDTILYPIKKSEGEIFRWRKSERIPWQQTYSKLISKMFSDRREIVPKVYLEYQEWRRTNRMVKYGLI